MLRVRSFAVPRLMRLHAPAALAALWVCGCMQTTSDITSKDHPNASDTIHSIDLRPRYPRAATNDGGGGGTAGPVSYFGTPVETTSGTRPARRRSGGFALNFENTPVATVAKAVLGDILNVGYVIDPRAQGTISLSSGRPIAKKDMLFVLENALRANNLVLVRDTVGYRIAPATDGSIGAVDRPTRTARRARIRPDGHSGSICFGRDAGQADGGLRRAGRARSARTRRGKMLLVLGSGVRAPDGDRHRAQFRRRLAARPIGRHLSGAQQRARAR